MEFCSTCLCLVTSLYSHKDRDLKTPAYSSLKRNNRHLFSKLIILTKANGFEDLSELAKYSVVSTSFTLAT
jgi:hypothetical protein